jgi:hypothetical protein
VATVKERLGFDGLLWVHQVGSRATASGSVFPLSFPRNCNRSALAVKGSLRRETRAPLTAPGRSELLSAMKEWGALGKAKSESHLTDTGILMEGDYAQNPHPGF